MMNQISADTVSLAWCVSPQVSVVCVDVHVTVLMKKQFKLQGGGGGGGGCLWFH